MPIASSSQAAYDSYVARLQTLSGTNNLFNTAKMIETIEGMRKSSGEPLAAGSKKNYYVALFNHTQLMPEVADIYRQKFMSINEALKAINAAAPLPPDTISWDELQTAGYAIMQSDDPLEHRILAGLVTQVPPMRLDYTNLRIFKGAPPPEYKGNYVHLKSPKMSQLVVQEHKTAGTYGALTRKLPEPVYTLIKQWATENPNKPLLDMLPNTLGKMITRIFMKHIHKPITMNTLRHSYVTAARAGDRKLSEVRQIAKELGHSIYTNEAYRRD
jgi:integrase